jgi:hypothetical protein
MNYTKILKRAWDILWSYKTLWIFGIILALTTASGTSGGGVRNTYNYRDGENNYNFNFFTDIRSKVQHFFQEYNRGFFIQNRDTIINIAIATLVVLLLLIIITKIGKYVSQTALIKMVDKNEDTGEKVNWRQGFRLGWSRQAWQLFLINLLIYLPLMLVAIALFLCAFLPVGINLISENRPTPPGIIATIGLFFLILFILAIIAFILSFLMEIIYRECVLKGHGVIPSIRDGWKMVIHNIKDVFLMWLILIGVKLSYMIVSIPVVLLLLGIALMAGGGVGVLVYFIMHALNPGSGWIVAAIIGGGLFMVVFSIPKLFLDGLFTTYISSVWTLVFRELNDIPLTQEVLPAPDNETSTGEDQKLEDENIPSPI